MSKVFTITEGLENMGALKTGGQGSVYKTRRTGVMITAVKLLPTPIFNESLSDKNYISFQNEVQKLKKVNEEPIPNVVKILSSGVSETGSFPYIEMEFIEGPDLEECLKPPHDAVFTIRETIKVAEHVANALAHCHKQDVKHGDIKSNNVKYNIHTGNYVLLDFGMAVMSDEQRRTSLRHAGAIEFMAPEQGNGSMLFETDIYSYGVILYELLAGVVPFPLNDRNESSRNHVMVAHMETPPPDLMALRKQHLPAYWDEEQKAHEIQVPGWLLEVIHKCLEKKPEQRFPNGMELQKFITRHSVLTTHETGDNEAVIMALKEENKKLRAEYDDLKRKLGAPALPGATSAGGQNPAWTPSKPSVVEKAVAANDVRTPSRSSSAKLMRGLGIAALVVGLAFLGFYFAGNKSTGDTEAVVTDTAKGTTGEYIVVASKAYFHNEPDLATRRDAYLVPSSEVIRTTDERNGFVYTEFTNSNGKTSSGWIRKKDLITLDEWNKVKKDDKDTAKDVATQLDEARGLLKKGDVNQASSIYSELVRQEVPEAMYQYANLTLHNLNSSISCGEAFSLLKKASGRGYTPAKRTLGMMYLFAGDQDFLQQHNYDHCVFDENEDAGMKLLSEAALEGDPDAQGLLDEYESKNSTVTPQ
jgi:serine/threonine protein kinase